MAETGGGDVGTQSLVNDPHPQRLTNVVNFQAPEPEA